MENWTPTIEKSKEVVKVLLLELQALQTKLQQKSANEDFQNEITEYVLGDLNPSPQKELESIRNNQQVVNQLSPVSNVVKKEASETTDDSQIEIKQESPTKNDPISNETTNNQSLELKAAIKIEHQDVPKKLQLEETKHIYLPVIDPLPAGTSFQCLTCSARFQSQEILTNHLKVHSEERPFNCRFCPKNFKRSNNLKDHEKIHTGEKPFRCETCGKCFVKRSDLTRHNRTHTGERPYQCDICKYWYSEPGTLRKHKRLHALGRGV